MIGSTDNLHLIKDKISSLKNNKMERYRNRSGKSGVDSYEIGGDYITVKFTKTFKTYTYSYARAGKSNVEEMKILAINGEGLNAFINKYVRNLFD